MKIDKNIIEPKWYEFNKSVKFKIKPFPFSAQTNTTVLPLMEEQFMFCLVDWQGIHEKDGKTKLPVTDENKKFLYDYSAAIMNFVIGKVFQDVGLAPDDLGN